MGSPLGSALVAQRSQLTREAFTRQTESRTMSIGTLQMETIISHDLLLQLLQQTFGSKVELIDYTIGNQHHDYLVLLVQLRHPSIAVVVKLAGPEAPLVCPFERTAMLHHLVATRTTIPMPEVVAVNMSYQSWPWRYFIKTHIPGQEWAVVQQHMGREELADAYQQMGNAVAQAYEAICPIGPLYTQRRPIHQLLWCLEYAQPTAEHLADTQRLCAEQGLPSLGVFE